MSDDIAKRLRDHVNNRGGPTLQNGAWEMMLQAADEIERLRGAFLGFVQQENECAKQGRLCGPGASCGCKLEMQDYIDDAHTHSP